MYCRLESGQLNNTRGPPDPPEDPGKPVQNPRNGPPEGPKLLDVSRGERFQTEPGGGGPPGCPSGVMTSSSNIVLRAVARAVPSTAGWAVGRETKRAK